MGRDRDTVAEFGEMLDALHRNEKIAVANAKLRGAEKTSSLPGRAARARLPQGVEAFYRQVHSVELNWRLKAGVIDDLDGADVYGSINIIPLEKMLEDWADATGNPSIHPFDIFEPEACTALIKRKSVLGGKIHYHYFGEDLVDLGIGFEGYIDRLLNARGFKYFVLSLSKETAKSEAARHFKSVAPRLFEDFRDDLFLPR